MPFFLRLLSNKIKFYLEKIPEFYYYKDKPKSNDFPRSTPQIYLPMLLLIKFKQTSFSLRDYLDKLTLFTAWELIFFLTFSLILFIVLL